MSCFWGKGTSAICWRITPPYNGVRTHLALDKDTPLPSTGAVSRVYRISHVARRSPSALRSDGRRTDIRISRSAAILLVRCFQNNAPMSSGCIVDFVTPGMDDGLAIDVGNEGRQAFLEFVFGADVDVAQDRTRQL